MSLLDTGILCLEVLADCRFRGLIVSARDLRTVRVDLTNIPL